MTEVKMAQGIGKEIIRQFHDHNKKHSIDDSEYIPMIKRIIKSITTHLGVNGISESENNALNELLVSYAKELYVELCQAHAKENNEDISSDQVKEESEELFEYIYEHEEYPY